MPKLQRKFVAKLLMEPKQPSSDQGPLLFKRYFYYFFSVEVI